MSTEHGGDVAYQEAYPDFKTIADFRKDNIDCTKKVFREFVYHSMELGLVGGELASLDETKLKAVNSKKRIE